MSIIFTKFIVWYFCKYSCKYYFWLVIKKKNCLLASLMSVNFKCTRVTISAVKTETFSN